MVTINNPPLQLFRLTFRFLKLDGISFTNLANIESTLINEMDYDVAPKLNLIQSYGSPIDFPFQIQPISYRSSKGDRELILYADALEFRIAEYSRWADVKQASLDILHAIKDDLNLESIISFRLEYIDKIEFSQSGFEIEKYFNLHHTLPDNNSWKLNFEDYHIGINIKTEHSNKFIIKLRGIQPQQKDSYTFQIESVYLKDTNYNLENQDHLVQDLDIAHREVIEYFLQLLSEKTKQKLGVFIDNE